LRNGTNLRYVHQESLGSTSVVTNSSGTEYGYTRYYPYGSTRDSGGSLDTDKKFTGQRLDATGLYYYGARYYDPSIGRFISADTVVPEPANPQSLNRYSYCINNPLKYTDPSGYRYLTDTDQPNSGPFVDYWSPDELPGSTYTPPVETPSTTNTNGQTGTTTTTITSVQPMYIGPTPCPGPTPPPGFDGGGGPDFNEIKGWAKIIGGGLLVVVTVVVDAVILAPQGVAALADAQYVIGASLPWYYTGTSLVLSGIQDLYPEFNYIPLKQIIPGLYIPGFGGYPFWR